MHRPIFGHSFAVLVAPILLSVLTFHFLNKGHSFAVLVAPILLLGLTFHFLNKKKASVRGSAKDANTGASDSLTAPTRIDSNRSSSSPTETHNGASSSSTVPTGNNYEVFLSFRGPDTRNGFTDHLYKGLIDAGIRAFRDDEELRQGEEIGPDLLAAIKKSKILIPIISENYGSSKWCLEELVQIMEYKNNHTGYLVLPIFYKVAPADVRYQNGKFKEAFQKHESRLREGGLDLTILGKWRQALSEVSDLKGREANGSEVKLVKLVVRDVLFELKKKFELVLPENLIGIDNHVKKVMEYVDKNSHTILFVGIHGMGGIGKTTLAKFIYNELSKRFDHRSFIDDVRKSCEKKGFVSLQNHLIFHILNRKDEVSSKDEGIEFISSRFKDRKVLILLDDMDHDDQLEALAGNHNWFSSGSIIIITTRNKSILDKARVHYEYDLEEMGPDNSLILFSRHAFRRDSPPSEFKDLTHNVVSTTGGLPLSLKVIGSFLSGKEQKVWRGTIEKLRKVPDVEVQKKLRISYDALTHEQKQIFLDIACFFIGTDRRIASYMWEACEFYPEVEIEVLRFLSLIKIGNDHELIMHDQLRDLGREIVCKENKKEPRKRSRLWDSEEVLKVLKANEGRQKIEAIYLSSYTTAGLGGNIHADKQFKNLTRLRFLHVSGANFIGDFENSIEELRWLQWHNCPFIFEAKNFHVKKLVALELLDSKISDKWRGWDFIKMAKELKVLDLTRCQSLKGTSFLSAFKNLEVLIIKNCSRLEHIHSSIGDMKSLVRLDLCTCQDLKELPDSMEALQNLQILNIRNTEIKELPNSVGALQNLEILDIGHTKIKELPNSIGALRNLEILDICDTNIKELPTEIGRLKKLRKLNAKNCKKLQSLPVLPSSLKSLHVTCQSFKLSSLFHLTLLKELGIFSCKFLDFNSELLSSLSELSKCSQLADIEESELQKSLVIPFKLEILDIYGGEFREIMDVSQLSYLRSLSVKSCTNILEVRGLDKLKYLESLIISWCEPIERLDLPKSKDLKILHALNCKNLVEIQGLDRLEVLEELRICECISIERLDLPKAKGLNILVTQDCKKLVEIQGLDRLELLKEMHVLGCTLIERLDLPKSKSLKILCAQDCENLVKIQGLDRMEFIEVLYISRCTSLERLDLPKSEGLKILDARYCKNLFEIQGLSRLEFLEELHIFGCASLKRLDLSKSKSLKILDARRCEKLVEIHGLDRLEFLNALYIYECASIKRLDLGQSEGLMILDARYCRNLVEIQGLDRLKLLVKLEIFGCASLKRLDLPKFEGLKRWDNQYCGNFYTHFPITIGSSNNLDELDECIFRKLPKSEGLEILDARNCENLVEIQGLDRLEFLKELHIFGCASLKRLDLPKSEGIKRLNAQYCKNLVEIQGLDRLEFLEELYISSSTLLERLDLSKSKNLKIVKVEDCKNLVEIQGLDRLEFLEELCISGCASIERLDLSKSESMKILDARDCKKLVEIQGLDRLEFLKELHISRCVLIKRPDLPKSEGMKRLNV